MYLSYYNLKEKPFQMSTDPAFLWLGEKHREALAVLKYAILENKGVLALTGDVGTGKTTLINALLKSLGDDTITATIYDPRLGVLDFFNTMAAAFRIEGTFDGKGKFILKFMDFLMKAHERNQKILLIIDEAQGINEDLLEEIRLLSNLEAKYTRLLNIFFVGQNEFIDILQKYENRALRQRVTIRYHIQPLTLNETVEYIKYRLKVAGSEVLIFDSGAIDEIFFFSGGYPRLINIMCDHALLSGYVREVQVINANLIRECREELLISKETSENDFQYPNNDYRSLPSETLYTHPRQPTEDAFIPVEDTQPTEDAFIPAEDTQPAEDAFIPAEDPHSYEDEKMVFSTWQPMSEREDPRKSAKKRFYRSPIAIVVILLVGLAAGYYFYDNDRDTAESFVKSAQQQAGKYLSEKAGSEDSQSPTVQARSETSDSPGRVEAGRVGDSRFFMVHSPNASLQKEAAPEEGETSQVMASKQLPETNSGQTDTAKPGNPGTYDNSRTIKDYAAAASNVPLQKAIEKESPKKMAPATIKPVETVPSNLKEKVPDQVPLTEKTPEMIQTPAPKPAPVHTEPKTIKTKAVKPVKKPEPPKAITKPVKAKEKTSEKYQARSKIQKKIEPESTKNTKIKKGVSTKSAISSKKQAAPIAAKPLVSPPRDTVISKNDLAEKDNIVSKKKVRSELSVPEKKRTVNRVDEKKVVSLNVPAKKSKTAARAGINRFNLHARLKAFLDDYCRTYEQKDLDKFSTFFALNAVEKGKPFRSWLSKYRQNFNRIDSLEYNIELERYATQEETGLVKIDGLFHIRAKLGGSKEWRKNSGQISMVLETDGNSFKIKELDY